MNNSLTLNNSQIAFVIFSDSVNLATNFMSNTTEIKSSISSYNRTKQATNIGAGLYEAAEIFENSARKEEVAVKKLAILLTDGANNQENELFEDRADALKNVSKLF